MYTVYSCFDGSCNHALCKRRRRGRLAIGRSATEGRGFSPEAVSRRNIGFYGNFRRYGMQNTTNTTTGFNVFIRIAFCRVTGNTVKRPFLVYLYPGFLSHRPLSPDEVFESETTLPPARPQLFSLSSHPSFPG